MNVPQRFQEAFKEAMEKTPYPCDQLSDTWWRRAADALYLTSTAKLGINGADWGRLIAGIAKKQLTLYEFALLSNNMQERTPSEFNLDLDDYGSLMCHLDTFVELWNAETKALREKVVQDVQAESQMREAAEKGIGNLKVAKA